MTTIEKSIDIAAPLETTFRSLCWFESYPEFMRSIERVRRDTEDPAVLRGTATLGTLLRESVARVEVDEESHTVSWRSEGGLRHSGRILLSTRDDGTTTVSLDMEFRPTGFAEILGDKAGVVRRRVGKELARFATYVESSGEEAPAHKRVPETAHDDRARAVSERMTEGMFGRSDDTGKSGFIFGPPEKFPPNRERH